MTLLWNFLKLWCKGSKYEPSNPIFGSSSSHVFVHYGSIANPLKIVNNWFWSRGFPPKLLILHSIIKAPQPQGADRVHLGAVIKIWPNSFITQVKSASDITTHWSMESSISDFLNLPELRITTFLTCWYFELMPKWTQFRTCQEFRPFLFHIGFLSSQLGNILIWNKNTLHKINP